MLWMVFIMTWCFCYFMGLLEMMKSLDTCFCFMVWSTVPNYYFSVFSCIIWSHGLFNIRWNTLYDHICPWSYLSCKIYIIFSRLSGCDHELTILMVVQPTEIAAFIFRLLLVGSSGHSVQSQWSSTMATWYLQASQLRNTLIFLWDMFFSGRFATKSRSWSFHLRLALLFQIPFG